MSETTQTPPASSAPASEAPSPPVDVDSLTLSLSTQTAIDGLVRAGQAEAWLKQLDASLQHDVDVDALTLDEAAAVAKKYGATAPTAKSEDKGVKTTVEANQAQVDAAAKAAAAATPAPAAATTAAPAATSSTAPASAAPSPSTAPPASGTTTPSA